MIKILKDILFSFYLLISSVVFSVILTLNISPVLYSLFIKLNIISKYNNLSSEEILNDYNNIIHYLNSPQEEVLKFKNFKISPIGEFHFLEVKEIFSSIKKLTSLEIICTFYRSIKDKEKIEPKLINNIFLNEYLIALVLSCIN